MSHFWTNYRTWETFRRRLGFRRSHSQKSLATKSPMIHSARVRVAQLPLEIVIGRRNRGSPTHPSPVPTTDSSSPTLFADVDSHSYSISEPLHAKTTIPCPHPRKHSPRHGCKRSQPNRTRRPPRYLPIVHFSDTQRQKIPPSIPGFSGTVRVHDGRLY